MLCDAVFQLCRQHRSRDVSSYCRVGRQLRLSHVSAFAALLLVALSSRASSFSREEPAFQGHSAETQMRSPEVEARRRALFFDDVDLELGPQGLPCDHLVRSRPETVAGNGFVVLLEVQGAKVARARVWLPPGAVDTQDAAGRRALAELGTRMPGATAAVTDVHGFAWCR